jgi:hypothetical protein
MRLPARMADYQRINKLASRVEEESAKTAKTEGDEDFLPYNKLSELVTRDEVRSAFQDANISDAEDLVDFVLKDAKRLFLILVMMSGENDEKLSLLRGLQRDEIKDATLPIGFIKENNQYYGYSLEGRLEGRLDGPQFAVFNEWERRDCGFFDSCQWRFTAPVFDRSRFRFHFAGRRILPFLKVAPKPASSGFFGEVSQIEIHSAHIPGLEAVSNLSLCS